jgi:hypothetical protein
MATLMERLQALGIGQGVKQYDPEPIPEGFRPFEGRQNLDTERLLQLNGKTYVGPSSPPAAPINTTGFDLSADIRMPDSPIPPMPADGMGGYSQGGVFSPPAAPMRVERPPERPAPFNPEQQIDGSANRMQDIIPVKPNVSGMLDNLIEREFARAKGRENAPSLPLRRSNSMPQARSVMPQRGPEDNTGLFYTLPDATMPTGVGGQLEPLVPDMFGGQLPMPSPTEYNSDPLGINDIPIRSNPFEELPLGTIVDEQGNLVNAQTGAIVTPDYQPNY